MKKFIILLVVFLVGIGFIVADDHTNPFLNGTIHDQVCRVYDVDNDGIVDGTELTTEEFTLMHLRFRDRVRFETVDFEEFQYRNGMRRRTGPPQPGDKLPDEPLYGPRRYRK